MRKIAASLLAAACAFTSATAVLAANQDVYYSADNSVQIKDSNLDKTLDTYKTVLIRRTPANASADIVKDDVVYINQNSSGLGALSSFMLKKGAEAGNYTATFGNNDGEVKEITFEIYSKDTPFEVVGSGDPSKKTSINPDNKMSVYADAKLQTEQLAQDQDPSKYTKVFNFIDSNTALDRIYLVSEDGKTCYGYFNLDISAVVTGVPVSYGIQLFNLEETMKGMNIYLGSQEETK